MMPDTTLVFSEEEIIDIVKRYVHNSMNVNMGLIQIKSLIETEMKIQVDLDMANRIPRYT
jgi:hypothetical protein